MTPDVHFSSPHFFILHLLYTAYFTFYCNSFNRSYIINCRTQIQHPAGAMVLTPYINLLYIIFTFVFVFVCQSCVFLFVYLYLCKCICVFIFVYLYFCIFRMEAISVVEPWSATKKCLWAINRILPFFAQNLINLNSLNNLT